MLIQFKALINFRSHTQSHPDDPVNSSRVNLLRSRGEVHRLEALSRFGFRRNLIPIP